MEDRNELPKRKPLRLKGYDYSSCGAYFVTICTKFDSPSLWLDLSQNWSEARTFEPGVGANCVRPLQTPPLSSIGIVIDREIQRLDGIYPHVSLDRYCIMPDHLHFIVFIASEGGGRTQFAPTLSRIVKQFKGTVTKQINCAIWQRSFNDRIIRSEAAYYKICAYIENNPLHWRYDQIAKQKKTIN